MTEGDSNLPISPIMGNIIRHAETMPCDRLAAFAVLFAQVGEAFEHQLRLSGNDVGAEVVAAAVQAQAVAVLRPQ